MFNCNRVRVLTVPPSSVPLLRAAGLKDRNTATNGPEAEVCLFLMHFKSDIKINVWT
jgi:hypothetical protein